MLYNQPQQPNYSKKAFIEPAHTPCGQLLRPVPRSRLPAAPPAAPQAPGAFPASPPQGSLGETGSAQPEAWGTKPPPRLHEAPWLPHGGIGHGCAGAAPLRGVPAGLLSHLR